MPVLQPAEGQSREEYIHAFMDDPRMVEEFADASQRLAVAHSAWSKANKGTFVVTKAVGEERLVSGWANVALQTDGTPPLDWQGDIIDPTALEKAAINFMLDYRGSGVMHEGDSKGVVVESIVFTKDKQEALGIPPGTVPEGWFITVKVFDDEVFNLVKSGVYRMFSIQGRAKRIKL